MKKSSTLLIAAITSISFFASCSHRRHNHLNVSVSDSRDIYKLQASYNEDKTGKVQRYINRQLAPNGLFASAEDYFDVTTELKDRTRFYIKSSPGKLLIKINRRENSYESFEKIKNMCEGVAAILKEK